jgi:WD40 repeat protein
VVAVFKDRFSRPYVMRSRFSKDGRHVVSCAHYDGRALVWNAETGELIHELRTPDAHVFDVAFNPDGTRIATCGHHVRDYADYSQPSAVRLWNAKTGKEVASLPHPGAVHSVAFSADGKRLATGAFGSDRRVRIWDVQSGAEVTPGTGGGSGQVNDVAFSPNGTALASADDDGMIRLWDAATGKLQRTLRGHTKPVRVIAFDPDGKRLASGAEDGTVRMWDLATGDGRVLLDKAGQYVTGVDFSRDGKTLAAAVTPSLHDESAAGLVQLWDVGTDAAARVLPASGGLWGVALSPDGTRVAAVGARNVVYWWDRDSGRALAEWDYGTASTRVRCAAFDPSGRLVATSAHREGDIRIWEAQTGHLLRRLQGHSPIVVRCAWRADGQLLASVGYSDGTVILWDRPDAELRRRSIKVGLQHLHGVAFSPEGRYLVTANSDGTVYVLRLAKQGEVFQVPAK